ncbi:MAG TPA: PfkB family carbohydrate kinase [Gaiellales bacterium]|nr:PfkB family carbohydrate kinase [Gaiellales bacterium]
MPGDGVPPELEAERRVLAERLHDGPQQILTALRLLADGSRHALEDGDLERARQGIERVEQLAAQGGDELRRLCEELDPSHLGPAGERVAVIGPAAADEVVLEDGTEVRRPGGTPHYAARALAAAGACPVAIETGTLVSRLRHTPDGTEQEIASIPEPLTPDAARELLPRLEGCSWVLLGGQTAGDFPAETVRVLADGGLSVCLDGQGLARGSQPGPVRLGPIDQAQLEGVTALKLNEQEARAAGRPAVPELLITRAHQGCILVVEGREHVVAGNGRRFADPTGAGDSFAALYCLGRTRGLDPAAAAASAQEGVQRLYDS